MSPDEFIDRWKATGGNELANDQFFLTELTEPLDLPRPEPASGTPADDHRPRDWTGWCTTWAGLACVVVFVGV